MVKSRGLSSPVCEVEQQLLSQILHPRMRFMIIIGVYRVAILLKITTGGGL